jgi:hypothetical protein
MVLMDNTQALALIERAERAAPFCDCGEPMAPVARRTQVWLECTTQSFRTRRGLRGLLAGLAAASHDRQLILDPA